MGSDSRSERERLKEEYKAHYRKMRQSRERVSRAKKTQNIAEALQNMDKSQMLESFDTLLQSIKHKLASVEARLDIAMDSLTAEEVATEAEQQLDEEMNRSRAKETLQQLKMEMGLLYEEIEQQAGSIQVEKTIGSGKDKPDSEERHLPEDPGENKDKM